MKRRKPCLTRYQAAPSWLQVDTPAGDAFDDPSLKGLDEGEKAALVLAASLVADLVLMDDRDGVRVARSKGFRVTGALGVIDLGARRGLLDIADAFERIKRTNFRYRQEIMDELLNQKKGR